MSKRSFVKINERTQLVHVIFKRVDWTVSAQFKSVSVSFSVLECASHHKEGSN